MVITPLPPPPSRTVPATFADLGDAFLGALPTFATEMESARQTAESVLGYAAGAEAAYIAAAATTGVTAWVSGTTYAIGDARYSPLDLQTYRRTTAGAGTTDPSQDPINWRRINHFGQGADHAAGSVTLTANSPYYHAVTATAYGQSITLPDARYCVDGLVFTLFNTGAIEMMVVDGAGTLLGFIHAGERATLALTDTSTAAGAWAKSGLLAYGLDVNQTVNMGDTITTGQQVHVIDMDGTRKLLLLASTTELNAVVFDGASGNFGASALVYAGNVQGKLAYLAADANTALVSYYSGSTAYALAIGLSGTAITVNAAASQTTVAAVSATYDYTLTAVGTSYILGYTTSSAQRAVAMTISAGAVTFGTAVSLSTTYATYSVTVVDMGSSVALMIYADTASGTLKMVPYSVSGTTLTAGTGVTGVNSSAYPVIVRKLASGRVAVIRTYIVSAEGYIVTVSGTTATATSANHGILDSGSKSTFAKQIGNQVLIVGQSSGGVFYANVITDNAGTAVAGTLASLSGNVTASYYRILQQTATGLAGVVWRLSADNYPVPVKIDISGNNAVISTGAGAVLAAGSAVSNTATRGLTGKMTWYDTPSTAEVETLSGTDYGFFFGYDKAGTERFALGTDGERLLRLPLLNTVFENAGRPAYESPSAVWGMGHSTSSGYQTIQRLRIA